MVSAKFISKKRGFTLFFFLFCWLAGYCQQYETESDASPFVRDSLPHILKRFENLRISGYIQPQFQVAEAAGAQSYEGGNFPRLSNNRVMVRRGRVKLQYVLWSKRKTPMTLFSFQVDATEKGVNVKDLYVRIYETRKNNLSMTAGYFVCPFSYEVNLGSSYRESPERGRMSQVLIPGDRDLGVMFCFEQPKKEQKLHHLKWVAGYFNGPGSSGLIDLDSHKDFISRLSLKPYIIHRMEISGGLSFLRGGLTNGTKFIYSIGHAPNGDKLFVVDSSVSNLGHSSHRHFYGADLQLKWKHAWGETEAKAEYWFGTQPGTANSTTSPGIITNTNAVALPTYIRHFSGAFLCFAQNIINRKHQLIVKYDWYDPDSKVKKAEIGKSGTNLTAADIKFNTLGIGYAYYFNLQFKLLLYYDFVQNELSQLPGYTTDVKDNVFTCRLQCRF